MLFSSHTLFLSMLFRYFSVASTTDDLILFSVPFCLGVKCCGLFELVTTMTMSKSHLFS